MSEMTFVTEHAIFVSFIMPASLSFVLLVNFSFPVVVYEVLVLLLLSHTHVWLVSHLTWLSHHLHVGHVHLSWGLLHHVHVHWYSSWHCHAIVHLILIVHSLRLI